MTDTIVVLVTVGSQNEADHLATTLVEEHLVACVNIVGPIRSVYRWQGRVHNDEELLLVIKTRAALFESLATRVRTLHSYETPEVIALPIVAGAQPYLDWLLAQTEPVDRGLSN